MMGVTVMVVLIVGILVAIQGHSYTQFTLLIIVGGDCSHLDDRNHSDHRSHGDDHSEGDDRSHVDHCSHVVIIALMVMVAVTVIIAVPVTISQRPLMRRLAGAITLQPLEDALCKCNIQTGSQKQ